MDTPLESNSLSYSLSRGCIHLRKSLSRRFYSHIWKRAHLYRLSMARINRRGWRLSDSIYVAEYRRACPRTRRIVDVCLIHFYPNRSSPLRNRVWRAYTLHGSVCPSTNRRLSRVRSEMTVSRRRATIIPSLLSPSPLLPSDLSPRVRIIKRDPGDASRERHLIQVEQTTGWCAMSKTMLMDNWNNVKSMR